MGILILHSHPASTRLESEKNKNHVSDFEAFKKILIIFSELKTRNCLSSTDIDDFKSDLMRNSPMVVINFVEKAIEISLLHPYIYLMLFEVVKLFSIKGKIDKKRHLFLLNKLFKKRGCDIEQKYDIKEVSNLIYPIT